MERIEQNGESKGLYLEESAPTRLGLLGVSFRTAPIAVRESLSFSSDETRSLLESFREENPGEELLVLSTCNRTEFYLAGDWAEKGTERLVSILKSLRPNAPVFHSTCQFYEASGSAVAEHLFRVASGIDSAILGDGQVLGQVRSAYCLSRESGTLGRNLERLLNRAIRAGRRARSDTAIGFGNVGLGSAIASLIKTRSKELESPRQLRILIVGAGEIAREIGRSLSKDKEGELVFLNRSRSRAEVLAAHCEASAAGWESLESELALADFVIAATSSKRPIITRTHLAQCSEGPRLFIDAGVPRNIEALAGETVFDVDMIRAYQEDAAKKRSASIPEVEECINRELSAWKQEERAAPVEEMIAALFRETNALGPVLSDLEQGRTDDRGVDLEKSIGQALERHARNLRRWLRDTERGNI